MVRLHPFPPLERRGYRSIATIGPLFLLQSIAGLLIGLGVVVVRRLWAAVVGIGFALATLAGFLLSVVHGLFGFKDSWLAPFAQQAFVLELLPRSLVAAAVLCLVGSVPRTLVPAPRPARDVGTTRTGPASCSRSGAGPATRSLSAGRRRGRPRGPARQSGRCTRTKLSAPMTVENSSSPIWRKKMLSLWLACAASDAYLRPATAVTSTVVVINSSGVPKSGFSCHLLGLLDAGLGHQVCGTAGSRSRHRGVVQLGRDARTRPARRA